MSHTELIRKGYDKLEGNWLYAIAVILISSLLVGTPSSVNEGAGSMISLLLTGAIAVGTSIFFLNLVNNREVKIEQMFDGFKNYFPTLVAYILTVFAIALGIILLIIPGIIIGLGLSQTFYILAEDKEISGIDAMKKSWDMMDGHKADYFLLFLLFILMALGGLLVFIIGIFFVLPIVSSTQALFYEKVKASYSPVSKVQSV